MKRTPRLAVLGLESPNSRASWSGIPYFALCELQKRFADTHVIDTPAADSRIKTVAKLLDRFGFSALREPVVTSYFEHVLNDRVEALKPDIVVSIGAAHKVSRLVTGIPLIHVSDALFPTIVDYYSKYRRLNSRSRRLGETVQTDLMRRADHVALSSDWAAAKARDHYPEAGGRIHTIAMGANVENTPSRPPARSNDGPLRLLFVGYDWRRKGGDVVLSVFEELRRQTGTVELHIVGCVPPETVGRPGVVHHGVLSKCEPRERDRLETLFRESSLFFMPSHEEAYGLVYCEACAFGLPVIARQTGGVPSIIRDGENGLLLGPDVPTFLYVARILALWRDGPRYLKMQEQARNAFETRLNWNSWGLKMEDLIYTTLGYTSQVASSASLRQSPRSGATA